MSVPFSRIAPRSIRPLPASRPSTACAVVVLPEPEFAHQGHDLAGLDAEGNAMDDPLVVVARLVGDRQIVDLEQRRVSHGAVF